MASESLKLAREQTKRDFLNAGKDVTIQALSSPLFQLLAFCVAVELFQKIRFNDEPILSNFLANTLETTVVTAKGLEVVGSSLGSIAGAIAPLKGLIGG